MSDHIVAVKTVTVEGQLTSTLLSNGIVEIKWHPEVEQIEVEHLDKIREILFEFGGGKKMPVYLPFTEFVAISKEARADASTEEGGRYTLANALHLNSPVQRQLYNFFMAFNNPVIATKAFTTKEDAFEWLLKLAEGNK